MSAESDAAGPAGHGRHGSAEGAGCRRSAAHGRITGTSGKGPRGQRCRGACGDGTGLDPGAGAAQPHHAFAPGGRGIDAAAHAASLSTGTLAVLAILSFMGVYLTLHEGAWAGAIAFFALLALAGIALGRQRYGRSAPTVLAMAGAALIVWVMFAQYDRLIELAGFALLLGGATWDWKLRRPIRQEEERNG